MAIQYYVPCNQVKSVLGTGSSMLRMSKNMDAWGLSPFCIDYDWLRRTMLMLGGLSPF